MYSPLGSPIAVDLSFSQDRFATSTTANADDGIDAIKNASLYDLIKI